MNSPMLYGRIQLFSCDSFYMANRMWLDTLCYITWQYGKLVHRPLHSKIPLTSSLTWQTDHALFTPENGFQGAIKRQGFPRLCSSFLCTYCSKKKMPERAPTKTQLCVLSIIDQLRGWAHWWSAYAQLSLLYPSFFPYVTHMINYLRLAALFICITWID